MILCVEVPIIVSLSFFCSRAQCFLLAIDSNPCPSRFLSFFSLLQFMSKAPFLPAKGKLSTPFILDPHGKKVVIAFLFFHPLLMCFIIIISPALM